MGVGVCVHVCVVWAESAQAGVQGPLENNWKGFFSKELTCKRAT